MDQCLYKDATWSSRDHLNPHHNFDYRRLLNWLHLKAELFLPMSNNAKVLTIQIFGSFEEKPQLLSNQEAEKMLHILCST